LKHPLWESALQTWGLAPKLLHPKAGLSHLYIQPNTVYTILFLSMLLTKFRVGGKH